MNQLIWNLTHNMMDSLEDRLRNPIVVNIDAVDSDTGEQKTTTLTLDSIPKVEYFAEYMAGIIDKQGGTITLTCADGSKLELTAKDLKNLPKGRGPLFNYVKAQVTG